MKIGATPVSAKPVKPFEVVGHRGDVWNHIENTAASLRAGWAKGDAVEVDVQITKDGKLVLFHDDNLGPHGFHMPGRKKQPPLTQLTLDQLQKEAQFNQTGWEAHMSNLAGKPVHYKLDDPARIPTLDEILPIPKDKKIYFEIKRAQIWKNYGDNLEGKLVDWIKRNNLTDRAVVISFNPFSLYKTKVLAPHIKTGLDDEHFRLSPFRGPLLNLAQKVLKLDYFIPDALNTTKRTVKRCHKLGMEIVPYMPIGGYHQRKAANNTEMKVMQRMIQYGVDGLVTNQPEALKQFIQQG